MGNRLLDVLEIANQCGLIWLRRVPGTASGMGFVFRIVGVVTEVVPEFEKPGEPSDRVRCILCMCGGVGCEIQTQCEEIRFVW